jgi:hypothetical protein
MWRRLATLAAMAVLLTGCFVPYDFTERQGAVGTVIDDETGAPITGALVVVSEGNGRLTGYTDPSGKFVVPGITKWGLWPVPADPMGIPWALSVQAKGYSEYSTKALSSVLQISVRDIKEIRLKKEMPNHVPDPTPASVTPVAGQPPRQP